MSLDADRVFVAVLWGCLVGMFFGTYAQQPIEPVWVSLLVAWALIAGLTYVIGQGIGRAHGAVRA